MLIQVNVPKSVKTIEKDAFRGSKNLTKIVFSEGSLLENMNHHAFRECDKLK